METPPLWKIWLEGLYTLVRRFFRPTDIKTYHKPVHFKWKCIQILITLCLNFENVAKNCNGIAINEIFSRHRKKGHVGGCPKMLPVFAKPTHRIYSSNYSSSNLSSVEPKNRISLKVLFSEKNLFDDKLRSAVTPSEVLSNACHTKAEINFFSKEKSLNQNNSRRQAA